MKTKRHGWVLQHKLTKKYAGIEDKDTPSLDYGPLKEAYVLPSRKLARDWKSVEVPFSGHTETVVKVALTKKGKPYKVIGKG